MSPSATTAAEREVRGTYQRLSSALVDARIDVLADLLDEDCTATHITGDRTGVEVRGDRATTTCTALYDVTLDGYAGHYRLRSTLTWRLRDGRWKAIRGTAPPLDPAAQGSHITSHREDHQEGITMTSTTSSRSTSRSSSNGTTTEVVVVIGAGSMGQAIARRISTRKTVLLADLDLEAARAAATALTGAGYTTATAHVDVADQDSVRELVTTATGLGEVVHLVHTAGLSPAQASPQAIINVDLVGVAYALEEFGAVIAAGGSGIVISSQAGHMLPPLPAEQNTALGTTPAAELAALDFLQPDAVTNSGAAYAIAKRANILRVQAASVIWGDRGARLNSLSPGIIMTPLALDELNSPAGALYQDMIKASASGRVGTPDEVATTAAFLMGRDGAFITGTDLLIDGGVIASIVAGRFQVALG